MVSASVLAHGQVGILPQTATMLIASSTGTLAHVAVLLLLVIATSTSTSNLAHASADPSLAQDSGKNTPTTSSTRTPVNTNVLLRLACSMATTGTPRNARACASSRLAQITSTGISQPAHACARVQLLPIAPPPSHGTRTAAAAENALKLHAPRNTSSTQLPASASATLHAVTQDGTQLVNTDAIANQTYEDKSESR